MRFFILGPLLLAGAADAQSPSFDCAAAERTGELAVCADTALAALDVELARLYAAALDAPELSEPEANTLRAMQRGWIKGRDACWKAERPALCVRDTYADRIHALVAGPVDPRTVPASVTRGPVVYDCDGMGEPVQAVFVDTAEALLSLRIGANWYTLIADPAASGGTYGSESPTFRLDGDGAQLWLTGSEETVCRKLSEVDRQD